MKYFLLIGCTALVTACNFNKSTSIDLAGALTTRGEGISVGSSYLTHNNEKVASNEVNYGERIGIHFGGLEGFTKKGNEVFPGMRLVILDGKDTLLDNPDLYANYKDPITLDPLELYSEFVVERPMQVGKSYKAHVHLWDKKGTGTVDSELEIKVVPDPAISAKAKRSDYENLYLYDQKKNVSIRHGKIRPGQEIYIIYEGVTGFKETNGTVNVGMSLIGKDKAGRVILTEPDVLLNKPQNALGFSQQLVGTVVFNRGEVTNPILLDVVIWDKDGDAKIESRIKLEMEQ